jgi:hypothetical protein
MLEPLLKFMFNVVGMLLKNRLLLLPQMFTVVLPVINDQGQNKTQTKPGQPVMPTKP